ncbi:MAG: methionyl aminopeptidase [Simkaniaceae bacterium]|nr:methionyl aminopeptidase [Simkaniaceae bacterium]
MINRNDPCWCGSNKKWKKCHYPQVAPRTKESLKQEYKKKYGILIKSPQEIEGIRASCTLSAYILDALCKAAKEGVTTLELDHLANELLKKHHAISPCLNYGYPPYPKSICTSINEVVCHGIPENRKLKNGDIMNIDISTVLNGFYGDTSRMVCIGDIDEEKKRVVDTAYDCLMESIAILKPGLMICEIGNVIESVARRNHCSVVYQFVGHGCGLQFHEEPQVYHNYNNLQIPLQAGMTFTIEPMINAGIADAIIDPTDGWTARTADGKPSAQWEHLVLITDDGHEILTMPPQ